jgi:hypothetical protein
MGKPTAPTPPDPTATARAATGTNVSTAIANAQLGNVNQVTPAGSLDYSQSGTYNFTDPTTGSSYDIPQFTATQSLTPIGQQTLDQTNQAKLNLASIGNMSSAQLQQLLGQGIDLSHIPAGGNATWGLGNIGQAQGTINNSTGPQSTFADAGNVTTDYGPDTDFATSRANVENSLFQRVQSQNDRDLANLQAHLDAQGIRYGSPAYTAAMDNYQRGLTDQRLGITAQGGAEQKLQSDIAAQRAGFQNAAQQQAYQQAQGRGTFANSAQAAGFQQDALRTQALNSALAQQQSQQESRFNAEQAQRAQALSEQYALRNQPLNEISALLSGSQVSNPAFLNTNSAKIPTTDVAGIINSSFTDSLNAYKQDSSNYNNLIGGLFGGLAGIIKSDVRAKENIHKMGSVMAGTPQKVAELPIYQYSYKDDPASTTHVGPLAQEVEKVDPGAVYADSGGTKYVDTRRVMGGLMRAA